MGGGRWVVGEGLVKVGMVRGVVGVMWWGMGWIVVWLVGGVGGEGGLDMKE